MKFITRRVTAALACVVAIAIAAVFAAGWLLRRPAQAPVGAPPAHLAAEIVAIAGGSSDSVHAWFSAGRPGGGAVLLLHSVRSNRSAMLGRATFLRAHGYGVLLVDLQAHGETRGSHITFGARESRDAHAALSYLRRRSPGERVGVIGVSLGGAAALLGRGPLPVDAMVLEAVYPTIEEATADRLRIRLGAIGAAAAPLLTSQLRLWTGVAPEDLRPIDAIGQVRAPVLLIAGAEDRRTTLEESKRLFAAAPSPKELWVVSGAAHVDYHALRRPEYEARVSEFFGRYLRAAG